MMFFFFALQVLIKKTKKVQWTVMMLRRHRKFALVFTGVAAGCSTAPSSIHTLPSSSRVSEEQPKTSSAPMRGVAPHRRADERREAEIDVGGGIRISVPAALHRSSELTLFSEEKRPAAVALTGGANEELAVLCNTVESSWRRVISLAELPSVTVAHVKHAIHGLTMSLKELSVICKRDGRTYTDAMAVHNIVATVNSLAKFQQRCSSIPTQSRKVHRLVASALQVLLSRADAVMDTASDAREVVHMLVAFHGAQLQLPDEFVTRSAVRLLQLEGIASSTRARGAARAIVAAAPESDGDTIQLPPAEALQWCCLIGELAVVGHHQLRRLFHHYLPYVSSALPHIRDPQMLLHLVRGFALYSVVGEPCEVLRSHLETLLPHLDAEQSIRLVAPLRTINRIPRSAKANHQRGAADNAATARLVALEGAEAEYRPLVKALADHITRCVVEAEVRRAREEAPEFHHNSDEGKREDKTVVASHAEHNAATAASLSVIPTSRVSEALADAAAGSALRADMATLVRWYCVNAQLEYPGWDVQYGTICDAVVHCCWPPLSQSDSPGIPVALATLLSFAEVKQLLSAILKRNQQVPYHPLHEMLVDALAHHLRVGAASSAGDMSAMVSSMNALFLSKSLMTIPAEPQRIAASSSAEPHASSNSEVAGALTLASAKSVSTETEFLLHSFRKFGSQLHPKSFVGALAVLPLDQLPAASQSKVVSHFSTIAASLSPFWLCRGIGSIVGKMPQVCDDISVRRWLSKFDGSSESLSFLKKQTHMETCRVLESIAALEAQDRQRYSATEVSEAASQKHAAKYALAKATLVRHLVARCDKIELDDIAVVSSTLRTSKLFSPKAFSRLCRSLLAHCSKGPLGPVCVAVGELADIFTSRLYKGTVFGDVWDIVRHRAINEAHNMTLSEVTVVLNTFSQLDVHDVPLLQTTLRRWWSLITVTAPAAGTNELLLWRAQLYDLITATLQPTARAVVMHLLSLGYLHDDMRVSSTLIPTLSLAVAPIINDLYPSALLLLYTSILTLLAPTPHERRDEHVGPTEAAIDPCPIAANTDALQVPLELRALHCALDDCRSMLLRMYGTSEAHRREREAWGARVKKSTHVPPKFFVDALVSLSSSGTLDPEVYGALFSAGVADRWLRSPRGIAASDLVVLTLATVEQFSPKMKAAIQEETPSAPSQTVEGTPQPADSDSSKSRRKKMLAPLLNALWHRVDELEASDVSALKKCLYHHFEKQVDTDFIERLDAATTRPAAGSPPDDGVAASSSTTTATEPPNQSPDSNPDETAADAIFF